MRGSVSSLLRTETTTALTGSVTGLLNTGTTTDSLSFHESALSIFLCSPSTLNRKTLKLCPVGLGPFFLCCLAGWLCFVPCQPIIISSLRRCGGYKAPKPRRTNQAVLLHCSLQSRHNQKENQKKYQAPSHNNQIHRPTQLCVLRVISTAPLEL